MQGAVGCGCGGGSGPAGCKAQVPRLLGVTGDRCDLCHQRRIALLHTTAYQGSAQGCPQNCCYKEQTLGRNTVMLQPFACSTPDLGGADV